MKKFTLSLRQLLGILVLSAALLSCKSKAAFDYSQNFVKKESTLTGAITETENKIGTFIRNEQYDSIVACADRMEAKVDAVMKEVKDEPAPSVKEVITLKKPVSNTSHLSKVSTPVIKPMAPPKLPKTGMRN